jgi:tetratricopeptide (TPR) repeat protein
MYDGNMKDPVNAIICYKKAIQFRPEYFDANYNMGALYFNEGAELMNKANAIPADKVADYKAAKAKADDKLKEALPFLEKAHAISPQDMPTMESLKNIYYRLAMTEKMEAIKKEIDAMKK